MNFHLIFGFLLCIKYLCKIRENYFIDTNEDDLKKTENKLRFDIVSEMDIEVEINKILNSQIDQDFQINKQFGGQYAFENQGEDQLNIFIVRSKKDHVRIKMIVLDENLNFNYEFCINAGKNYKNDNKKINICIKMLDVLNKALDCILNSFNYLKDAYIEDEEYQKAQNRMFLEKFVAACKKIQNTRFYLMGSNLLCKQYRYITEKLRKIMKNVIHTDEKYFEKKFKYFISCYRKMQTIFILYAKSIEKWVINRKSSKTETLLMKIEKSIKTQKKLLKNFCNRVYFTNNFFEHSFTNCMKLLKKSRIELFNCISSLTNFINCSITSYILPIITDNNDNRYKIQNYSEFEIFNLQNLNYLYLDTKDIVVKLIECNAFEKIVEIENKIFDVFNDKLEQILKADDTIFMKIPKTIVRSYKYLDKKINILALNLTNSVIKSMHILFQYLTSNMK